MERRQKTESFGKLWDKYKFVALVALLGIVLLLWPAGSKKTAVSTETQSAVLEDRSLEDTEAEMEKILARIDGVGQLQLMLTVENGPGRQLASNTELSYSGQTAAPNDYTRKTDTVVVSQDGGEEPVVTGSTGPVYRGALVVCQGADSAKVRLAVTSSVSALTGLGSDRITVVKCQ